MVKAHVPRPWTEGEIAEIRRLAAEGASSDLIAAKLDRAVGEIEWAAARHGIGLSRPPEPAQPASGAGRP